MEINKTDNPKNRFSELDSLRGLAALSVVLFHFTYGYDNGLRILTENHFYFRYGYLGVQLFFMISGFVILMTLNKTKTSKSFVVSRFSRLYPAYWSGIILTVLITTLLNAPFQQGIYSLKQVLVNFTMLQYWLKIDNVDGAYWTLAIELTFYVLMWFIYKIGKLNSIVWYAFGWLILTFLFFSIDIPLGKYIKLLFILNHAPMFVAGIGFYIIQHNKKDFHAKVLVLISLITELFVLNITNEPLIPYLAILFFYIVFYLFVINKLRFLSNKVLIFFGSISYSLYLIHENIGLAIIYRIKKIADYQIVYVSITLLLMIFMAYCITTFIEQPSMKWIRQKFNKA